MVFSDYLHIGPVTITKGATEPPLTPINGWGVVLQPRATVVEAPDLEHGIGVLDVRVLNRAIDVLVKVSDQTAETWAMVLGVHPSNIEAVGEGKKLNINNADTRTEQAGVIVAWTRNDGKPCRLRIKRAAFVPTNEQIPIGKGQWTTASFRIQMLDPEDDSSVPGYIEIGTTS